MVDFPIAHLPISIETSNKNVQLKESSLPTAVMQQTHSNHYRVVTSAASQVLLDTDAMVSELPNLQLQVKTADCLPIMFYHPLPLIGVIHAGRKGTNQQITKQVFSFVKNNFGINDQIHIFFGPYICASCYQIDPIKNEHYDLAKLNIAQIFELFTNDQVSIWDSRECTCHQNQLFYSYRAEGTGVSMNYSRITLQTN